jgi:hypothetical protein
MAAESESLIQAMAALDAGLVALAVVGLLRGGLRFPPHPGSLEDAFAELEASLWRAFPSIPPGYTLREALSFLRRSGFSADWEQVEASLEAYEGRRFGGLTSGTPRFDEVAELASKLRRHGFLRAD